MPSIIRETGYRQTNPIYRSRARSSSDRKKHRGKSPEKTESIPKTYDAIKTAAGASMKPKK